MSPEASMQLLDRLWQRYDTLVAAHGVYKARSFAVTTARAMLRELRALADAAHAHAPG